MMSIATLLIAMLPGAQRVDTLVRRQTLPEASIAVRRSTATLGSAPQQRVEAADIKRQGAATLAEVVATLAGVSVKDYGGVGGLKTVSIRSLGAHHTGVSYDGIIVGNAQHGQVDIGRFNLDRLQQITVDIAGSDDIFRPASLAAYAGSLALETRRPNLTDSRPHGEARLRYGSFAAYAPYVSLQQQFGSRWTLDAWADVQQAKGDYPFILKNGDVVTHERRLNSALSQQSGELTAYASLHRLGSLRLRAAASSSSRGLPGSVVLYTQHPTEHLYDRNFSLSAQHNVSADRWRFKASLAYSNDWCRYTDASPRLATPADDRYTQQQMSLSMVALWQPQPRWQVSLAEDVAVAHLESNIPEALRPTRTTNHTALSAKYADGRFTAVATLLALAALEHTTNGTSAPSRQRLSPTASVSYRISPRSDWRVRLSFRENYRLPTFNDLYYARVGNRHLLPERAHQTNVGLTWQATRGEHRISVTADGYYNRVRDKIVAVPTMFLWSMRNVGCVEMTGLDLAANYSLSAASWLRLTTRANFSWQHAIDVTNAEAKNYRHQIAYTPRYTGTCFASAALLWFTLSYTLQAVGERYSLAQNVPAYRLEPFFDHTLSLSHTLDFAHGMRLHISGEATNLAGRNYEIIHYYPMPGRSYRLTLRFAF